MPYSKVRDHPRCGDDEWGVVKDDDGRLMGCHDSESEANAQIAALNAQEND